MATFVDTRIVTLTSQSATTKRNGTYLSDLFYSFGSIYLNDPSIIHRQVQLLNAQIPYSFYVINYTNQIFKYKLGTGAITSKNIPVGNYTANSLITALKTAINDVNMSITISSINGQLTFEYNTSFIIYNDFTYSIGSILGFAANSTNTGILITAPYALNLLGIKTLHIRSGNLVMKNVSSVQGGQTILLANIPVSAVPFGMIDYTDSGKNNISIDNQDLDDISLELLDGESGAYINMNGQDWCVTLAFHLTKVFTSPVGILPLANKVNESTTKLPESKPEKKMTTDEQQLHFLEN
jgi:hypothetical protein